MDEETLKGVTAELATPTLQDISGVKASLTEEGKVPSDLLLGFRSDDSEIRKTVVIKIGEILRNSPPSQAVQPVVDTGLVSDLVSLLDSDDTQLQREAAAIVANIACGTTQQTKKVIDAGAIIKLVRLAVSPDETLSEHAVWALANIVRDSVLHRDRVEDEGGINALVTILNRDPCPTNAQRRSVKHLLPCLVRYIRKTPVDKANMESLECAVQSLRRICNRDLKRSDFIETEVVPRLVQLVADSSSSVALQSQALNCLGYLVSGNEHDTDVAINAGMLPALSVALTGGNQRVYEIACFKASNIAAGNQQQVQAFLDSGLLEPVVRILMDGQNNASCRREACWVISNLTRQVSDDRIVQTLIKGRCLEGLSAALLISGQETKERAIFGITNLLKWKGAQASEEDSSPLAILRSASCPQNLRVVRDSHEFRYLKLKKDCHDILTRYFPEYSRRARV
ncbi:Importin alpha subunit (Karyopherin alpha subunit) (Serine-rich RNA polymerase I suppressor protein) [Tulasnella sp. 424]|nr:Importin alpha subunit (Karyopherin alpha subunit) (Serine-rich RNA polymerase I suppressor protein) [Tulasnella sp. 424]